MTAIEAISSQIANNHFEPDSVDVNEIQEWVQNYSDKYFLEEFTLFEWEDEFEFTGMKQQLNEYFT